MRGGGRGGERGGERGWREEEEDVGGEVFFFTIKSSLFLATQENKDILDCKDNRRIYW